MKISSQSRRDSRTLFNACRVQGVLDENRVRTAVQAVAKAKPRGYLAILTHFHRLVKLDIARRTAHVENAIAITPEFQQSVKDNLAKKYGNGLTVNFSVNPALIGGMRVRVGSDVMDSSIAYRLQALSESF